MEIRSIYVSEKTLDKRLKFEERIPVSLQKFVYLYNENIEFMEGGCHMPDKKELIGKIGAALDPE